MSSDREEEEKLKVSEPTPPAVVEKGPKPSSSCLKMSLKCEREKKGEVNTHVIVIGYSQVIRA
jgi:hypothetical protein